MDENLAVSQINCALSVESLPVTFSRKGYPRYQVSRFDRGSSFFSPSDEHWGGRQGGSEWGRVTLPKTSGRELNHLYQRLEILRSNFSKLSTGIKYGIGGFFF